MLFPCGQCMPCRVNRLRVWSHRIMLEASLRGDNTFATLTYSPEALPLTVEGVPTLKFKDLTDWLKRLRKAIEPERVRYFAVGEYGDATQRPHFHIALFGYPNCRYGNSRYSLRRENCCSSCDRIRDTWQHGQIFLGDLNINSAQYVAGYVTKKMTSIDDDRLKGRTPEGARMSLRPGIGADFMHEVASTLLEHNLHLRMEDVPDQLQHGSRKLPLGRYLKRHLRSLTGNAKEAPESTIEKVREELRPLRETAFNHSRSFKAEVVEAGAQAALNSQGRRKIYKAARKL